MNEVLNSIIEEVDFLFENTPTRVVALRTLRKNESAGVTIGPFNKGQEFEVKHWMATELVKAGYAQFGDEDLMNLVTLNKIHWRETKLHSGRRISSLPEFFYPKLRRYMGELKERATQDPSGHSEYIRAIRIAQDLVNCRLKKIVNLSSSPSQTGILRKLSREERLLYNLLHSKVTEWKSRILDQETMG